LGDSIYKLILKYEQNYFIFYTTEKIVIILFIITSTLPFSLK